jgi:uncharacterized membrane protein YtjA (UPF0391 family)
MLKVSLGFVIAAVVAGVLGFGGWAGALTGIAVLAFYAFVVLAVLSVLASLVSGAGHAPGGALGLLVVAAIIGAGTYAWVDNGMTAEKLGRKVDSAAFELKEGAGQTLKTASSETRQLAANVGDDAERTADRIGDKADNKVDGDR